MQVKVAANLYTLDEFDHAELLRDLEIQGIVVVEAGKPADSQTDWILEGDHDVILTWLSANGFSSEGDGWEFVD